MKPHLYFRVPIYKSPTRKETNYDLGKTFLLKFKLTFHSFNKRKLKRIFYFTVYFYFGK